MPPTPKSASSKSSGSKSSGSRSSSSSSGTVDAVVLVDLYRWHDEHGNTDSPVNEATQGEKITVSTAEFKRARAMTPQALEKASAKNTRPVSDGVEIPSDLDELSDDELRELAQRLGVDVDDDATRDELVGAVAASPGGNERPSV